MSPKIPWAEVLRARGGNMATERRRRQRFRINAPLTVILGEQTIAAYTRDMSENGIFFYADPVGETLIDSEFEFIVEFPPETTLSSYWPIRCRGRVVRKERTSGDGCGIAAEILNYSLLRVAPIVI